MSGGKNHQVWIKKTPVINNSPSPLESNPTNGTLNPIVNPVSNPSGAADSSSVPNQSEVPPTTTSTAIPSVGKKQPQKKNNPQQQQQPKNNNPGGEQYYGSLLKNKTKVIIRNIPYHFSEHDFISRLVPKSFTVEKKIAHTPQPSPSPTIGTEEVDPQATAPTETVAHHLPYHIKLMFDPKKITWSDFHAGHKTVTQVFPSIAYLNFANVSLLHQFKNEFDVLKTKQVSLNQSIQQSEEGDENSISTGGASLSWSTQMTVEYCPLQMIPKQKKKDPRDGSIFKDEHYLKFLEQLRQPKELHIQPLSLDNSSTSGLGLDGGDSSSESGSGSRKLGSASSGSNITIQALGGVGASSSFNRKDDEPIISPLLKELLEKKNRKSAQQPANASGGEFNKPRGGGQKKNGKTSQYKRKY